MLVHQLGAMGRATMIALLYASLGFIAHAGVVPEPALCCGWKSSSNFLEPEKEINFIVQVLVPLFQASAADRLGAFWRKVKNSPPS